MPQTRDYEQFSVPVLHVLAGSERTANVREARALERRHRHVTVRVLGTEHDIAAWNPQSLAELLCDQLT